MPRAHRMCITHSCCERALTKCFYIYILTSHLMVWLFLDMRIRSPKTKPLTWYGSDFRFGCRSISEFMERRKKNFCIDDGKCEKFAVSFVLLWANMWYQNRYEITSLKCVVRPSPAYRMPNTKSESIKISNTNRMRKNSFVFSPEIRRHRHHYRIHFCVRSLRWVRWGTANQFTHKVSNFISSLFAISFELRPPIPGPLSLRYFPYSIHISDFFVLCSLQSQSIRAFWWASIDWGTIKM